MLEDILGMLERVQALKSSADVEVVTHDGRRVRGRIDNLRSTQPFSKPAVKMQEPGGKITKILFSEIAELIDHTTQTREVFGADEQA